MSPRSFPLIKIGRAAGATMETRRALILGIGGQDGYFMSQLLVSKGYEVTGLLLHSGMSSESVNRLPRSNMRLVQGSVCDERLVGDIVNEEKPEQIYNFAGKSFVPYSWEHPQEVANVNALAVGQLLNIVRLKSPRTKFFQACSSEMFGHNPLSCPQNEETTFCPDNPYGSSKVFAAHLVRNYRSRFGLFACIGILYNHESEWRSPRFVTRRITMGVASIKLGKSKVLRIGDVGAVRDWGYAGDFVEGMWLMMDAEEPRDYVMASGQLHSVEEVLDIAFDRVGLSWKEHVEVDGSLTRPTESLPLRGDTSLIKKDLGWTPRLQFEDLIAMMVDRDMDRLRTAGAETTP